MREQTAFCLLQSSCSYWRAILLSCVTHKRKTLWFCTSSFRQFVRDSIWKSYSIHRSPRWRVCVGFQRGGTSLLVDEGFLEFDAAIVALAAARRFGKSKLSCGAWGPRVSTVIERSEFILRALFNWPGSWKQKSWMKGWLLSGCEEFRILTQIRRRW